MNNGHQSLAQQLAYDFREADLLAKALTHRSAGSSNNERLEFLGDALLNWVIAEELCRLRPKANEGDLSRLRASLVRETALADIAQALKLGEYLTLGSGELRSGGHRRKSILADALEAVLAAVYLDGGLDAARSVILKLYQKSLEQLPDAESLKDAKTRLQEYLQGRGLPLPDYAVIETAGKAHQKQFTVRCALADNTREAIGIGSSRRQAEQTAACSLLEQLQAAT